MILILILIVNWQDSRLSITPWIRFRLRRSNSVFLQLQFEAFYTVNLLNAKWMFVPARNSGWEKITYMNHNMPEIFEFEAVILSCTGVGWRDDVLRFNRLESVNNFEEKD